MLRFAVAKKSYGYRVMDRVTGRAIMFTDKHYRAMNRMRAMNDPEFGHDLRKRYNIALYGRCSVDGSVLRPDGRCDHELSHPQN